MATLKSSRILRTISLVLVGVLFCPLAHGKVIYVDDNAAGANDGASWTNAYVDLQVALADANDSAKPVEIRVAQGVYKPDRGAKQAAGNREATFQLINGVTLRGGFAGAAEADPNARDHALYRTILSGDLNGDDAAVADPCDLGIAPTRAENSYHIVTGSGTDATAVLDGFTLTAGHADGSPPQVRGAALHNASGHPTVENSLFTANWAVRRGGAVYNLNSNPLFAHCIFTDNAAGIAGGAIFNGTSNATVTDCVFTRNTAADQGGAMFNNNASPIIPDCRFEENRAVWGGAMQNSGAAAAVITQCTFRNNRAADQGGGMLNQQASPILTNCIFTGNRAGNAGGGMENFADSRPSVSNCTFRGNVAGNLGGGIYNNNASPTVVNCLFSGNQATIWGGGMENFYGARPLVTNCTFTGNVAGGAGGALYSHLNCAVALTSCIVWSNAAPAGPEILDDPNSLTGAAYSLVQGTWPGQGNIDADPCFAAPGRWDPNGTPDDPNDDTWLDGDYHLLPSSPCIDAGDPNFAPDPNHLQTDLYGGPRLTGARIDMGADEYSKHSGGTGEPNDPYQIATAVDLIALGEDPNDYGKHFILTADIDLDPNLPGRKVFDKAVIAPDTDPNDEYSWFQGISFSGVFDGNGHAVSHLTILGGHYLGLFGKLESGAEVKELGVMAVKITGSGGYIGGLAGYNDGTLIQCYGSGSADGDWCIGGIVGLNCGRISASDSDSTVIGVRYVGGLVGGNQGTVVGCCSTGSVTGDWEIGGLVGDNDYAITNCYSTGAVSGRSSVGGLVGYNGGSIATSYSGGSVRGSGSVGGLVGIIYAYGDYAGRITRSYSTGTVSGTSYSVGGLVGDYDIGAHFPVRELPQVVFDCFWDIETSGQTWSDGGTGKTTAEMQTASTFLGVGWDFVGETANGTEDIWWIDEGKDYPRLWWEAAPAEIRISNIETRNKFE